jgi:ribonuclease Z
MKVLLLGTGGYYPTSRRHTACMMLPEIGVVLDAGTGMCRVGEFLQTERLDIFLTHAHLDHVAGLTYLLNLLPDDVQTASTVHGDRAKLAAIRDHLFAEAIFPVPPRFGFTELAAAGVSVGGGGRMSWFPLDHPGGSIGYRIEWQGHSLAYVTDTTARKGAAYVEKIRGVDLLIHEAYFADDSENWPANTGHSSLLDVARVAAEAEVKRLVLVHLDPTMADVSALDLAGARRIFGACEVGFDGMEVEF